MKRINLLVLVLAAAVSVAGCKGTTNTNGNSNNGNTASNTANANNTNSSSNASSSSSSASTFSTPTAAYSAAYETAKRKDYEAFKKTLSSGALKFVEDAAKSQNKSVNETLAMLLENPSDPLPPTLEVRGETINGDKATVEYKNAKGTWEKAYLVKEGGGWKFAPNERGDDAATPRGKADADDDDEEGANSGNSNTH
ncbi:MAG TPA: hypothetical protein VF723_15835 [Pyrinomonadaceae bacterium]